MKKIIAVLALVLGLVATLPTSSFAATEKEKSFVDAYKKAFESKDNATLESFLYTKGADPAILGFFKMMITAEAGSKISSIELKDLTADEIKKAMASQPSPDGKMAKLTLSPTKKLVLKVTSSDANGSSSSSSESFVAEVDGKYMIPVPGPVN